MNLAVESDDADPKQRDAAPRMFQQAQAAVNAIALVLLRPALDRS
jgi:hypothetical protein